MRNSKAPLNLLLASICLVLLACDISSLPVIPSAPSIFGPTATPQPSVIAIPYYVGTSNPSRGFVDWVLFFALENKGSTSQWTGASKGTLKTKEGFTYDVEVELSPNYRGVPGFVVRLPPGFRAKGIDKSEFVARASIGEQTHPQSLDLDGIGQIDIQSIRSQPIYPTERVNSEFLSAPDTFDIPGIARISVIELRRSTTKALSPNYGDPAVIMKFQYQSLNIGKAQQIPTINFTFFGQSGYVTDWNAGYLNTRGCEFLYTGIRGIDVGPGQTFAKDLCLTWGKDKPSKMLLQIGEYKIERIYNVDF